jgi:NADH-quinone oxidoreductase subunit F
VTITNAPRIVTRRLDHPDSHTLERYLATGGYQALRKALGTMTPEQVRAEVLASNLLGRGGKKKKKKKNKNKIMKRRRRNN